MIQNVKRGDIYYADLSPVVGSEQGGMRPVLIIQNDVGNKYSPTVIAAAITSRMGKTKLPTHIDVFAARAGLSRDSVVLLEQLRTLDKRRLKEKMGHLDEEIMGEIDNAIAVSLGLLPHGMRLPQVAAVAKQPQTVGATPPAAAAAAKSPQTGGVLPNAVPAAGTPGVAAASTAPQVGGVAELPRLE